ncbi:hypothetical protein AO240_08690 [Pseudomonas sp. ICMP 460]|nr:hypothetical protein AO240_08690 [Pseudomonas sp. ICMP 460]
MSFGLKAINDSGYVQIDSDTPRLCAIYSGVYASTSYATNIYFPAAITTQEPPCIFIRNGQGTPGDLYSSITLLGGAGAWTGFQIVALNVDMRPNGKWFAAVFASKSTETFGLRMWAADGSLIYDSGAVPVLFSRASHSWSFQGRVQISPVANGYYWRNALVGTLLSDEYFMINPFSRGLLTPQVIGWTQIGVRFSYTENCLQVFGITAQGAFSDMGSPGAVFARLPGT